MEVDEDLAFEKTVDHLLVVCPHKLALKLESVGLVAHATEQHLQMALQVLPNLHRPCRHPGCTEDAVYCHHHPTGDYQAERDDALEQVAHLTEQLEALRELVTDWRSKAGKTSRNKASVLSKCANAIEEKLWDGQKSG